jgi:hypothetical protein
MFANARSNVPSGYTLLHKVTIQRIARHRAEASPLNTERPRYRNADGTTRTAYRVA